MAKISWTKEAQQWMEEIYEYIARDNKDAAANVVNSIYHRVQSLKRLPEQGYRYFKIPERDIRILLYGHYRIAYLIKENLDVDILGVFHGSLNIERYNF